MIEHLKETTNNHLEEFLGANKRMSLDYLTITLTNKQNKK